MSILSKLLAAFTRRSLSNPPERVYQAMGVNTVAGVEVNERTAMTMLAVYCAIGVISEGVSMLPLHLYRRLPGGGKERVSDHPVASLLRRPNPELTAVAFRDTAQAHILTHGNCYAEVERDQAGRAIALWGITPDRVRPMRLPTMELAYEVKGRRGTVIIPGRDMLHIPGRGYDGLVGYSPIQLAMRAIGVGLAAEQFGASFFGNDLNPGGVLEHPGRLDDLARENLRTSLKDRHAGPGKAKGLMILEEGMKFAKMSVPPEEAQFLETRQFQVVEIARLYNVPPHKLGDLSRATFSNIEQQSLDFVTYTLMPWMIRWEQNLAAKLLTAEEQQEYFIEHLVAGLLRGDLASRYGAYAVARNNGWLNVDEIRELENLNPLPEGKGKVYLQPLNMVEVGATPAADPPSPPPAPAQGTQQEGQQAQQARSHDAQPTQQSPHGQSVPAEVRAAYEQLLAGVLRRALRVEADKARRLSREDLGKWYEQHTAHLQGELVPLLTAVTTSAASARDAARAIAEHHTADSLADLVNAERWESLRPDAEARAELDRLLLN